VPIVNDFSRAFFSQAPCVAQWMPIDAWALMYGYLWLGLKTT
jgi:hypothetical protein